MSPRLPPPILALTPGDPSAFDPPRIERAVVRAVGAGLRGVVLREAALSDRAYLDLARTLQRILERVDGGWLALHDRPHLVAAAGVAAVHLGGRSLPPDEARAWLGDEVALGLSTHAGDDPAAWRAADYVVHGPVRATTKPGARAPIGFEALAAAVRATSCAVYALGGLEPEDAAQVVRAGARGMAVLSGLLARQDVEDRTRSYLESWRRAAG